MSGHATNYLYRIFRQVYIWLNIVQSWTMNNKITPVSPLNSWPRLELESIGQFLSLWKSHHTFSDDFHISLIWHQTSRPSTKLHWKKKTGKYFMAQSCLDRPPGSLFLAVGYMRCSSASRWEPSFGLFRFQNFAPPESCRRQLLVESQGRGSRRRRWRDEGCSKIPVVPPGQSPAFWRWCKPGVEARESQRRPASKCFPCCAPWCQPRPKQKGWLHQLRWRRCQTCWDIHLCPSPGWSC